MPITKAQCVSFLQRSLGSKPGLGVVDEYRIINLAGQALVNMASWNWLQRPAVSLNLVASQTWIALPADLSEISDVKASGSLPVELTDLRELNDYRMLRRSIPGGFVLALAFQPDTLTGAVVPRLEVFPTPTANQANALLLDYSAGWLTVTPEGSAGNPIPVPAYCEPLFFEVLEAVAKGIEENGSAPVTPRMEAIRAGTVFRDAVAADAALQPSRGYLEAPRSPYHPQRPSMAELI